MSYLRVERLRKSYKVPIRRPGVVGAFVNLFNRRYDEISAIDDISLEVDKGEFLGYIGPNAAGKSTTLKILSGILVPDSGTVVVDGLVPWQHRKQHVRRIGVVFGQRTQLWWDLPVIESFEMVRDIYGVDAATAGRRIAHYVELLDMASFIDTPVRQLSLGQRMRCDLVAALLHAPQLLFLDEPTIGLDVISQLRIREFLREINRVHDVTIVLTSHNLDDIEALCHKVIVINHGRLVWDGTFDQLRRLHGDERAIQIDFKEAIQLAESLQPLVKNRNGRRVEFRVQENVAQFISELTTQHEIQDIVVQHTPIEEVIARLYASTSREHRD